MNVLFMSNWQKTLLFAPVAKILRERGFTISWVCTSPQWKQYLIDQGFPAETILHLRRDEAAKETNPDYMLVQELEEKTGDRFKSWALMDREVGHWEWPEIKRYGAYIARNFVDFFDKHQVDVIFGEPSTYHELISSTVCAATGRTYMGPFSLRLPVNRFLCWVGPYEKEFVLGGPKRIEDTQQEFVEMAYEVRDNVLVKKARPHYWYRNNTAPKVNARFIGQAARGVHRAAFGSKVDSNMYSLKTVFRHNKFHMRPLYYASAKVRWDKVFDKRVPGEKYVLFTLQKQPEYTIDVLAARFSNQLETIRGMARSLPSDVMLYVKEHRNSLGDRPVAELMKIRALPGVRLIDPIEDIHELIQNSEMVVSPASTASLEAALYGKPSFTMTETFMNGFSTCSCLTGPWELGERLGKPVEHDLDADMRYLGWVLANSYEGVISDKTTPENDLNVANGMEQMLNGFRAESKQKVTI